LGYLGLVAANAVLLLALVGLVALKRKNRRPISGHR
jgi:hypothetical protein